MTWISIHIATFTLIMNRLLKVTFNDMENISKMLNYKRSYFEAICPKDNLKLLLHVGLVLLNDLDRHAERLVYPHL